MENGNAGSYKVLWEMRGGKKLQLTRVISQRFMGVYHLKKPIKEAQDLAKQS